MNEFIETADEYLTNLTDDEYYNITGHNRLGDCFGESTRLKQDLVMIRRQLE